MAILRGCLKWICCYTMRPINGSLVAIGLAGACHAEALDYPKAPVRLIVSTGAGAAPDIIARIVAEALSKKWGQQVFVANHPGAAGSIALKVAGTSPPDGYTLLFALSSNFVSLPEISRDYPYDVVRDFVSIGFVCEQPIALGVSPTLGVNSLAQLFNYVKSHSAQINVAVLSRGGIPHLTAEWIKIAANLDWTAINYPGAPAGLSDVIGGRVQVMIDGLPSFTGAISGGQFKLLAVGSAKRLPNLPNTPTLSEALPAIPRALGWFALMGPPRLPEELAKKISEDLRAVMGDAGMKKRLEDIASYPRPMSPAELRDYIRGEQSLWKPVIEKIPAFNASTK
jgi:tripartite-type tricarboxylate transporter receptor subunit TctC